MGQYHCKADECAGEHCKGLEYYEDKKDSNQVYFVTGRALCRMIGREIDAWITPTQQKSKNADSSSYQFNQKEIDRILEGIKAKGLVLSNQTAEDVLRRVGKDSQGKLSREQFHDWIHAQCMFDKDNLFKLFPGSDWLDTINARAFKAADLDGKGFVDPRELTLYTDAVIKQFNVEDEDDIRESLEKEIARADKDQDSMWSRKEFRNIVKALIVETYIFEGISKGIRP